MKVEFIKNPKFLGNQYVIHISKFTPNSLNEVLNTLSHTPVTIIQSDSLVVIYCNDEATFNWLYLKLR